ncbi:MAG: hypothetical protein BAJALOKI1v1_410003 [Promethearchaeota archaeon]|nr:MAG: hypothetical protein BAJALOKI1v1_410003 [Candidatus Lokiarchaeota archaeon]
MYPFCDTIREYFLEDLFETHKLKNKDSIFEIYKAAFSVSRVPALFYETRRKTYADAWSVFGQRLIEDTAEQILITLTSIAIGMFVKITLYCIPYGASVAKFLSGLAYWVTYSMLTKYFMDEKQHQTMTEMKENTFLPMFGHMPAAINDRALSERVLRDSMGAALFGHTGAYYTQARGGTVGHEYTAQIIASPPNPLRMSKAGLGLIAYVMTLNPDNFIGLDFDYANLDYFRFTTELYAYNDYPYYLYSHEWLFGIPQFYDEYQYNTLGHVEQRITGVTNIAHALSEKEPLLNSIVPTCIDGVPMYMFVNDESSDTYPESPLHQPIVLNRAQYDILSKIGLVSPGHLGIMVRHPGISGSVGLDAHAMSNLEKSEYGGKIPLSLGDDEFGYPIRTILLHVRHGSNTIDTLEISEDLYEIDGGVLYLTKSLEEIASNSTKYTEFIRSSPEHTFYMVELVFDRYVAIDMGDPSSESYQEYSALALAQASQYAIMDVFNQYTFAEVTSNMIAEIGYTEQITLISTMCTAWAVLLDSWTTKGAQEAAKEIGKTGAKTAFKAFSEKMGTMIASKFAKDYAIKLVAEILVAFVVHPLKEVVEEIVLDGLIESCVEGYVREMGGSDNLGFWLSTLATSLREKLSLDTITSTINSISNIGTNVNNKINSWIPDLRLDADSFRLDGGNIESERSDNVRTTYKTMEAIQERIAEIQSLKKDEKMSLDQRERLDKELQELIELRTEMKANKGTNIWSILKSAAKLLGGITFTIGSMFFGGIGLYRLSKLIGSVGGEITAFLNMKSVDKTIDKLEQQNRMELDAINLYRAMPDEQQREFLKDAPANDKISMLAAILGKIDVDGIDKANDLLDSKATISHMSSQAHLANLFDQIRLDKHYHEYVQKQEEYQKLENIKNRIDRAFINEKGLKIQKVDKKIQAILQTGRKALLDMGYIVDSRVFDMYGVYAVDPYVEFVGLKPEIFKKWDELSREEIKTLFASERMVEDYRIYVKNLEDKSQLMNIYEFIKTKVVQQIEGVSYVALIKNYVLKGGTSLKALTTEIKSKLFIESKRNIELGLVVIEGNKKLVVDSVCEDVYVACQKNDIDVRTAHFIFYPFQSLIVDPTDRGKFVQTPTWEQMVRAGEATSPYYRQMHDLAIELMDLINKWGLTGSDRKIKTFGQLDELFDFKTIFSYETRVNNLKSGLTEENAFYFKPEESTIVKWETSLFVKIYREGVLNNRFDHNKIRTIKQIFNKIYNDLGYSVENKYYRDAYRCLMMMSSLLYDYDLSESTSLTTLSKILCDKDSNYRTFYFGLKTKGKYDTTISGKAQQCWDDIMNYLDRDIIEYRKGEYEGDLVTTEDMAEIKIILQKMKDYEDWQNTFFNPVRGGWSKQGLTTSDFENNPFGTLLLRLQNEAPFNNIFAKLQQNELSNFLFGSDNYITNLISKKQLPTITELMKSILRCFNWKISDLPNEIAEGINEKDFFLIQSAYIEEIISYISPVGRDPHIHPDTGRIISYMDETNILGDDDIYIHSHNEYLQDKLNLFIYVYLAYAIHENIERPKTLDVANNLYPGFVNYLGNKFMTSFSSIENALRQIGIYELDAYLRYSEGTSYALATSIYEEAIRVIEFFRDEYPHKEGPYFHQLELREDWQNIIKDHPEYDILKTYVKGRKADQGHVHSFKYMFTNKKFKDNNKVQDVLSPSDLRLYAKNFQFGSKGLQLIRKGFFEFLETEKNEFVKKYKYRDSSSETEVGRALTDFAHENELTLNKHDDVVKFLNTEIKNEILKGCLGTEIPEMIKFALNDPELKQIRAYAGVFDLFTIRGNTLYICDFKPDVHFDTEGDLGQHAANVFPQLVAYSLMVQERLKKAGSTLEVKCIAFNNEASMEFDPNVMFFQMFDFMTDHGASLWHSEVRLEKYSDGYEQYHNYIEPNDELKKFFIDFFQIVEREYINKEYGNKAQKYLDIMEIIIEDYISNIKDIYQSYS